MAEVSQNHSSRARRSALLAVAGVAVFALVFVGLIMGLDYSGPRQTGSDSLIPVATSKGAADAEIQSRSYSAAELNVPVKPFHVLLIGSDSRKGTALYTGNPNEHAQVNQHADVITLVRVDPQTYTITLVTIPRDTVLEEGGAKLNDALVGDDPTKVVDAVAQLTGVRSEFYMAISFMAFEDLVDSLGGITVDVPKTVTVSDPATGENLTVKAGKAQHLDGAQTLVFSRARKEYESDQDALRQVNVRTVEKALIAKALSDSVTVDVKKLAGVILNGMATNMSYPQGSSLLRDFARHADQLTIYECTGPFDGYERESDELWVVNRDQEKWMQVMELVEAGEDPSQVVPAPAF